MNNQWENNYVESMKQLEFTEKQQERMVELMLNQTHEKEKQLSDIRTRMPSGMKRLSIAGICLCIITAGTAVAHAAGALKPVSEVFHEIFHLEKETAKVSEQVGSSLNISDASGGVSITADAVLGDNYNFAVVFSIEKKDGTAFQQTDLDALTSEENTPCFRSMLFDVESNPGNQRGHFYFYDASPDDPSFQLLYTCTTDASESIGANVTASFSDFGYRNASAEFVLIASGEWSITFPLDYANSVRHFTASQDIKQGKRNIKVKKADISPIGFHFVFNIENINNKKILDEMDEIIEQEHLPMRLVLKDGTKINLNKKNRGCSILKKKGSNAVVAFGDTFQEIIPMEEMKSLCIGNLTLDF